MISPGRPDVLVLGGGITGCSVAREAAIRGWSVLLVERGDVAEGASSRSTKLLHGGLRYLERGDMRLVREALREREITARLAPHLARPLGFVLPTRHGVWPGPYSARLGVGLYDLLAGRSGLAKGRRIGARDAAALVGSSETGPWSGGVLFEDRQTDDARLTLAIARDAARRGAEIRTRCRVVELLQDGGAIVGAVLEDGETGERSEQPAGVVVNAVGPWADSIRLMAGCPEPTLRPSRGTHLVLPDLGLHRAVLFSGETRGHRLFAIPWRGVTLFGTTDVEADAADPVEPGESEVRLLWREARRLFSRSGLPPESVGHAFAGLRPLVRAEGDTVSLSREHRILEERGLVSVIGGKLTTWRKIAADAMEVVGPVLGRSGSGHPASTLEPLPGGEGSVRPDDPRLAGIDHAVALRWTQRYGTESLSLAAAVESDPGAGEPLTPDGSVRVVEVDFAVRREFARGVEDVLVRRLGLEHDPRTLEKTLDRTASRMRRLLAWSPEREHQEVRRLRERLRSTEQRVRNALARNGEQGRPVTSP